MSLKEKLHPTRFTEMSPKMAAIVGYIIGEHWVNPPLAEVIVTSDGFAMGRLDGDCGHNQLIGPVADVRRNWLALLDVAGLDVEERALADGLYAERIK